LATEGSGFAPIDRSEGTQTLRSHLFAGSSWNSNQKEHGLDRSAQTIYWAWEKEARRDWLRASLDLLPKRRDRRTDPWEIDRPPLNRTSISTSSCSLVRCLPPTSKGALQPQTCF